MATYSDMSLDDLIARRDETWSLTAEWEEWNREIISRRAIRDAMLDLAAQLEADGFVLIKEEQGFGVRLVPRELLAALEQGRLIELASPSKGGR